MLSYCQFGHFALEAGLALELQLSPFCCPPRKDEYRMYQGNPVLFANQNRFLCLGSLGSSCPSECVWQRCRLLARLPRRILIVILCRAQPRQRIARVIRIRTSKSCESVDAQFDSRGSTYFPGLSRSPPRLSWQQQSMYLINPSRLYKLI